MLVPRTASRLGESMPSMVASVGLWLATLIVVGNANGTPAERTLSTADAGSLPRRLSEGQPYVSFTSGASCEANGAGSIRTLADCSAAAVSLSLSDTTAEDLSIVPHYYPPYCYFDPYEIELYFNSAGTNTGGCRSGGRCICWVNAPPPPPPPTQPPPPPTPPPTALAFSLVFLGDADSWTSEKVALLQTALASALGLRVERVVASVGSRRRLSESSCTAALEKARNAMPSAAYDSGCTSAAGQIATTYDAVAEQYGCSLDYAAFDSVSTCDDFFDAYATLCEQYDGCVGGVDSGGGGGGGDTGEKPATPSGSDRVVVSVSIVEGTPDEPTAAEAAGTLQSLHTRGELQQALAAGGITDVLAQAPALHIEPAEEVIVGAALILAIVLPIVSCLLVGLLVALVVYCCCCKGKSAAAGAPAQPTAVEVTKTAV